jgi:hypothetical protein
MALFNMSSFPAGVAIAMLALFLNYWADKYMLLHRWRARAPVERDLALLARVGGGASLLASLCASCLLFVGWPFPDGGLRDGTPAAFRLYNGFQERPRQQMQAIHGFYLLIAVFVMWFVTRVALAFADIDHSRWFGCIRDLGHEILASGRLPSTRHLRFSRDARAAAATQFPLAAEAAEDLRAKQEQLAAQLPQLQGDPALLAAFEDVLARMGQEPWALLLAHWPESAHALALLLNMPAGDRKLLTERWGRKPRRALVWLQRRIGPTIFDVEPAPAAYIPTLVAGAGGVPGLLVPRLFCDIDALACQTKCISWEGHMAGALRWVGGLSELL